MNKKEKIETIKRYEDRLNKYGVSVKTMGWRNQKQQFLRFRILKEISENLEGTSVLDIGCGFGDFYNYLKKNDINVKYTGFDISPKIIKKAKELHPNAIFEVRDILQDKINKKYDYIFLSGLLNARLSDNEQFAKKIIPRMFKIAKTGVAVNLMSNHVDYREDQHYYYSPEGIFSFCKTLTRYVALRHDYPLYEFTVYLYHQTHG
jgi:SAM-dependent methyltransferase|tara:strand:+ start:816 stop:1430 length:615 start_codon:yes stop_codon:yes gene_type:complete